LSFQIAAAFLSVKDLMGRRETSLASLSEKRTLRILKSSSEGGAPCGNMFNL
jgi:hypothetical protein